MKTSGLVIALGYGGESLVELNKLGEYPVFLHVVRNIGEVAEEVIVAVSRGSLGVYDKAVSEYGFDECRLVEIGDSGDKLSILKEGLSTASGDIVITAPANAPLIPVDILALLAELCERRDAVLTRNMKGDVDWFLSAYNRRSLIEAIGLGEGGGMGNVVEKLRRVMYIAYSTIKDLDPMLLSSVRIMRVSDIQLVEKIIGRMRGGH
jgi:molybdopterin-guanine dinucleotide biosynthesis protein A